MEELTTPIYKKREKGKVENDRGIGMSEGIGKEEKEEEKGKG